MTTITAASAQWASRPDDQRFLDLESLQASVNSRREMSATQVLSFQDLSLGDQDEDIIVSGHNGAPVKLNHYSFGQLCAQAQIGAGELRKLPAAISQVALEYRLKFGPREEAETKLLYTHTQDGGLGELRSANGVNYGRIWDSQVVAAVRQINADGRWHVPPPFNSKNFTVDKQSTTLYASDRDVFMFLVDENRPIEIDGQTYFRGFYTWNSEVGERTFGLASFLYSYVCANRIIWGARDIEEIRIRHTSMAPDRFAQEAGPALKALSEGSAQPIVDAIKAAKATRIADKPAKVAKWLESKGIGRLKATVAVALAARGGDTGSSGDPTNLWDVIQGGTALARDVTHQDERIALEKDFSGLLRYAGKPIIIDA